MKKLQEQLHAPFPPGEIEWRVITSKGGAKPFAIVAPYVDARAITRRLDEVFGIDGWTNNIQIVNDGVICTLTVWMEDKWISRSDGANTTKIEPVKGGISDALKRAAALFGIGKYLYYVPTPLFADLSTERISNNTVKLDDRRYYWKPPEINLYEEAMKAYENILSGKEPDKSPEQDRTQGRPKAGDPVQEWELEKMKDLPIVAVDYFKSQGYTRLQVADFCRSKDWDIEKVTIAVDELTSSY